MLLQAGADDECQKDGRALRLAAKHGYLGTVEFLLDHDADQRLRRYAALMNASREGHTKVIGLLIERAENIRPDYLDRALFQAAINGKTEAVKVLLDAGAYEGAHNFRAQRKAEEHGHTETANFLRQFAAEREAAAAEEGALLF